MHYHTFFIQILRWPDGIIVGNLLASVVWSMLFEWRLRFHRRKTNEEVAAKLAEHHLSIKNHIDKRLNVKA